ncbi:hypothetical protein OIU79_024387, partial [Salix purpurea]
MVKDSSSFCSSPFNPQAS